MNKLLFTPRGIEKQKQKIVELTQKMDKLKIQLAEMADVCGDEWHDNFTFEQTIIQVADLEHFINEEQEILNQAALVLPPTYNEKAAVGHRVKIRLGDKEMTYNIAGYGESDPLTDILAYDAPIAKAIMGTRVGAKRELELDGRKTTVEILAIE
jgi:transcription elongation factor GreA